MDNAKGMQYLTFVLEKTIFAFDVLKTREVLSVIEITPLPGMPEYITGVLNLRGSVVPVINLRQKFGFNDLDYSADTAIIIVESCIDGENIIAGALVDSIRGVITFDESEIEPPPKVGLHVNIEMVHSIGKKEHNFVLILDSDKVLFDENANISKEMISSVTGERSSE
ncbi:MAG TPA: chemotaxis protein CheW [Spirochaetota bacterium]|nr:chemotaxis protein CheW [Spirochaetota bacterium]HOR45486.1 chemotaxis protein CheW [Spirochaetota bacterium]HOU86044.1 chemotaxis protein CheW [Spirochaetota bacterium]HPK57153.1 chemotaxis protein CheW [Spirochaetota bacterium]HQE57682.1 chemotaxis protein CheW [Spirochaetota bacterium]